MCGIWALFGYKDTSCNYLQNALKIAHRGPDNFRIETLANFPNSYLAYHQLYITDCSTGSQPMQLLDLPHIHMMYNGEIYNHEDLARKYDFDMKTKMDGEIIIHLYNKFGIEKTLQLLDGVYAIFIFDAQLGVFHIARDTFGVRPLFTMLTSDGKFGMCSEVKGLIGITDGVEKIFPYPPGTFSTFKLNDIDGTVNKLEEKRFTDVNSFPMFDTKCSLGDDIKENIRNLLTEAVAKRFMSKRRIGCLLSGGLDSSLITALVVKIAKEKCIKSPIQTFSIGLENSPDLIASRKVAEFLNTEHHEVIITAEEAFEAIEKAIYSAEVYDRLTINSSICLYILVQYIKDNTDTVVLFGGEGADEVTQGYESFENSRTVDEAHQISLDLLRDLYLFDMVRPDRMVAAHGLELRVPFLDKNFASYYLSLPKDLLIPKDGVEKHLLRSAFKDNELIPEEILWRKKIGFSSALSPQVSWPALLERHAKEQISEEEFRNVSSLYPLKTPETRHMMFYRKLFEKNYPGQAHLTPYQWHLKYD